MTVLRFSIALAAIFWNVGVSNSGAQSATNSPPPRVEKSVCRPTFEVDGRAYVAGTGFALSVRDHGRTDVFMVTAKHLFGPDGGLESDVPWNEMPTRAELRECKALATDAVWHAGRPLAIEGAEKIKTETFARDIALFPLPADFTTGDVARLKLAVAPPKIGDSVWVVAQLLQGAPSTQLLHHARVVLSGAWVLQYKLDNPHYVGQATSGAPVVNDRGELVGVNLGGGPSHGSIVGFADSLSAVKSALSVAKAP